MDYVLSLKYPIVQKKYFMPQRNNLLLPIYYFLFWPFNTGFIAGFFLKDLIWMQNYLIIIHPSLGSCEDLQKNLLLLSLIINHKEIILKNFSFYNIKKLQNIEAR